jgi:hypothetical protein
MAPARHCGLNCCQTFFATECERIGNTKLKRDVPQQSILGPRRSCVFIRHQSQPTGSVWQRQDLLNLRTMYSLSDAQRSTRRLYSGE